VRTDPPPRRLDVPLNSIIEIVFSTPIDSATLTGTSLQLMQGSTPVAGTTAFGDPGHLTVVFTPAAPLVPRTPYRLVATTAIADLHGSTLAANVETDFSTGDAAAATIASVTVVPDTVTVTTGNTVQVVAVVRDPQGATVPGVPVTWASDSTSVATVSSGGLVTTLGPGRATISASAAGLVGTARVTVSPTSISSITVTPDSATIVLGDSIRLTAQARDAKGAVIAGAPITWGTNDVTIVTVDQSGLVKPLAPGTATVEAFGGPAAGPHFGSARITVTAPSGAGPTP
jgi:hypothetical protein